jgi:hypothetical protein
MFTAELDIVGDPQCGGSIPICPTPRGVLLVTVIANVSPGMTCNIGFWSPSGVMKQKMRRPCSSMRVWKESDTASVPLTLWSRGGSPIGPPEAGLGQVFATGATGGNFSGSEEDEAAVQNAAIKMPQLTILPMPQSLTA